MVLKNPIIMQLSQLPWTETNYSLGALLQTMVGLRKTEYSLIQQQQQLIK